MNWAPGLPVLSEQDRDAWQRWRRDRKREQQRERRARYPRIDYYPDDAASAVIGELWAPRAGFHLSSVINRIVSEWIETRHALPPEFTNANKGNGGL